LSGEVVRGLVLIGENPAIKLLPLFMFNVDEGWLLKVSDLPLGREPIV